MGSSSSKVDPRPFTQHPPGQYGQRPYHEGSAQGQIYQHPSKSQPHLNRGYQPWQGQHAMYQQSNRSEMFHPRNQAQRFQQQQKQQEKSRKGGQRQHHGNIPDWATPINPDLLASGNPMFIAYARFKEENAQKIMKAEAEHLSMRRR